MAAGFSFNKFYSGSDVCVTVGWAALGAIVLEQVAAADAVMRPADAWIFKIEIVRLTVGIGEMEPVSASCDVLYLLQLCDDGCIGLPSLGGGLSPGPFPDGEWSEE